MKHSVHRESKRVPP